MRIISKFKDYYDGVQRQGYDPTVIYMRTEETLYETGDKPTVIPFSDYVRRFYYYERDQRYLSHDKPLTWTAKASHFLIVAGVPFFHVEIDVRTKIHVEKHMGAVVLAENVYMSGDSYFQTTREHYFDKESYIARLIELGEPASDFKKDARHGYSWKEYNNSNLRLNNNYDYLKGFDMVKDLTVCTQARELCTVRKTPIIVITREDLGDSVINRLNNRQGALRMILNPNLADIGFQKVMDAFTIYQELSMFVSGVIGSPAMPMVEISEKVQVQKKGFDPKYGFRKRPEKEKIK